ncbi:DUF222 domain-containing protein [Microbacterium sp. LMI12-1-1.1]|uniref:HNH endonuclease signature motif containing protein n=1 Tax=Microbacterium sp. LMI12-1-1.1 TaxID=3135225 RepID=UPI003419FBC8
MSFFSDMQAAFEELRAVIGDDIESGEVAAAVQRLTDDGVITLIEQATVLVRGGESLRIAGSGVVAARSTRDAGHGGLAQTRGHRSPVSLIQDLTGTTRADAAKQVRLGEALAENVPALAGDLIDRGTGEVGAAGEPVAAPTPVRARPWHAALGDALMTGKLTSAQHDAIYRGLGAPPLLPAGDDGGLEASEASSISADVTSAWETAAAQLIDEAALRTVDELGSAARSIRDVLDPVGADRRFEERFHGRSFRTWTDRDGTRRGTFQFEDEGGAWIEAIIGTALRPRRGGPRFVDSDERTRAADLVADPRSNDQLAYDLIIDVLRAGALADAPTVFGTRQPGIRIVSTTTAHRDAVDGRPAVALLEDSGTSVPGWLVAQHACSVGTRAVIHDEHGNPLDLGREARLYSPKQRIALAIRDGGCRWTGCDRPASYCEAHHIDHWHRDHGKTDIDRGILLCRFHHMQLHHGGWRITRHGDGDFLLHPPDDTPPLALVPRLARRYAFGDLQPPPRRFRPAA